MRIRVKGAALSGGVGDWLGSEISVSNKNRDGLIHDKHSLEISEAGKSLGFEEIKTRIFEYDIFPPHRMITRLCKQRKMLSVGDTIIQFVILGPLALEMAVHVTEICDESDSDLNRAGFTYATLEGHAEEGNCTFLVTESKRENTIRFEIETWSAPGNWVSLLLRPCTRYLQQKYTNEALHHVLRQKR